MAESESIDCPCSNIAIMQLFHELKQSYPTVPDQIVSKVIQENYHDKSACETILRKESHAFLQSYPGAIISGNPRESLELGSLCSQCPASRPSQQGNEAGHSFPPNSRTQPSTPQKEENAFSPSESNSSSSIYSRRKSEDSFAGNVGKEKGEDKTVVNSSGRRVTGDTRSSLKPKIVLTREGNWRKSNSDSQKLVDKDTPKESCSETDSKGSADGFESSSLNSSRTCSECDSERKSEYSERSHSCGKASGHVGADHGEVETVRWNVEDGGRISGGSSGVIGRPLSSGEMSVHNYQVAVQYSMQPALPLRQGGQQRSFTTVNLSLRPPSSEPQPPIEIQSGQNLTYTTSVFDAKKGVQSQLQIRIGPALLDKQKERKDLLARELRKEKEKLRIMQNEIRLMKASIAQKPSPHLLPKLKSEIERLRAECERLTAAVDLYSDTQNNLPLGETDEQFYRNIYTGQRLQREGSWSCQLCTFRNHPLLSVCEECEMPRISLGTQVMDVTSHLSVLPNNNTSFCTFESAPNMVVCAAVQSLSIVYMKQHGRELPMLTGVWEEEGHPHPRHSSLPPFKLKKYKETNCKLLVEDMVLLSGRKCLLQWESFAQLLLQTKILTNISRKNIFHCLHIRKNLSFRLEIE